MLHFAKSISFFNTISSLKLTVTHRKKLLVFFNQLFFLKVKRDRKYWYNRLIQLKSQTSLYSKKSSEKLIIFFINLFKDVLFVKRIFAFIRLKLKFKQQKKILGLPWLFSFYRINRRYFLYNKMKKMKFLPSPIKIFNYFKIKKRLITLRKIKSRYNKRRVQYFSFFFRYRFFWIKKNNSFIHKYFHMFFYYFKFFTKNSANLSFLNKINSLKLSGSFFVIPTVKLFNFFDSIYKKKIEICDIPFNFYSINFFNNLWNKRLFETKTFNNIFLLKKVLQLKGELLKIVHNYNFKFTAINKYILGILKNKKFIFRRKRFGKNANLKKTWFYSISKINASWVKIKRKRNWTRRRGLKRARNRFILFKQFFKEPINFLYYTVLSNINYFNFLNIIFIKNLVYKIIKSLRRKKLYLFLLFRFPEISINKYPYFFKQKRFFFRQLPIFGGMRYKRNFSFYRGVFLSIGHYKYLQSDLTYTGFKIPYLTLQNRKSFWHPIVFCFKIYSYNFINTYLFSFVSSKLHKLNLYTNFYVNFGWLAATRMILYSRHFYRYVSHYYFFGKHLLTPNFYSQIPLLENNVKEFFRQYFTIHTSDLVSLKRSHRFRKPININDRQITVMRHIRKSLCSLFFNDPKRTWYITQFCSRFYRNVFNGFGYLYRLEMSLYSIILRSRIVYTLEESLSLIQQGLVYVNGIQCIDSNALIKQNDRIQFVLSKGLHLYHREELSSSHFYRKKLKSYVFSFKKRKKHMKWKIGKKSWPLKHIWFNYDIPRYLEVDYLTMTIFVLYLPLSIKEMFTFNFLLNKFLNPKCYNWRFHY